VWLLYKPVAHWTKNTRPRDGGGATALTGTCEQDSPGFSRAPPPNHHRVTPRARDSLSPHAELTQPA